MFLRRRVERSVAFKLHSGNGEGWQDGVHGTGRFRDMSRVGDHS